SLSDLRRLDFASPDLEKFPCLRLAYEAADAGSAKTIALNAADEIAVAAFLEGKISFTDIARTIQATLNETAGRKPESIQEVLEIDSAARCTAESIVAKARVSA